MGQSTVDDRRYYDETGEDFDELLEIKRYITQEIKTRETAASNYKRKANSKQVYDYYQGVRQHELLKSALKKKFPKNHSVYPNATENVTKAIINTVAVVYKSPAKRVIGVEGVETGSESLVEFQDAYDAIADEVQLDFTMQKLERYNEFDQTSLLMVAYDTDNEKYAVSVYPQFLFDIIEDRAGNLRAVILSDYYGEIEDEKDRVFTVWTPDHRWVLDNELNTIDKSEDGDNEFENPYGFLPFIVVRPQKPDIGYYCDPLVEIAKLNENLNLLLSSMLYLLDMQVHGQPVAKNIKKLKDLLFGPETVIDLQPNIEGQDYGFEYVTPDADFNSLFEAMNRLVQGFTSTLGLPSNMFSFEKEGGAESGVALKIRNAPLLEFRKSREERYRIVEDQILDMIRQIQLSDVKEGEVFPEEMYVNVIFDDPMWAFQTPKDEALMMLSYMNQGLMRPTDIVMKLNPGMTREEAEEYLQTVAEEKKLLQNMQPGAITTQTPEERVKAAFSNGNTGA